MVAVIVMLMFTRMSLRSLMLRHTGTEFDQLHLPSLEFDFPRNSQLSLQQTRHSSFCQAAASRSLYFVLSPQGPGAAVPVSICFAFSGFSRVSIVWSAMLE